MTIGISLQELLGYSNHERAKWQQWLAADPQRMALPFQTGGRFETIGSLFAHIFLVERRCPRCSGIGQVDARPERETAACLQPSPNALCVLCCYDVLFHGALRSKRAKTLSPVHAVMKAARDMAKEVDVAIAALGG